MIGSPLLGSPQMYHHPANEYVSSLLHTLHDMEKQQSLPQSSSVTVGQRMPTSLSFDAIDSNHDGVIDRTEFNNALANRDSTNDPNFTELQRRVREAQQTHVRAHSPPPRVRVLSPPHHVRPHSPPHYVPPPYAGSFAPQQALVLRELSRLPPEPQMRESLLTRSIAEVQDAAARRVAAVQQGVQRVTVEDNLHQANIQLEVVKQETERARKLKESELNAFRKVLRC